MRVGLLRHRSVGRYAVAGLTAGLLAFAGLGGLQTVLADRTAAEVRDIDTIATRWNLLLVRVNAENDALARYLTANTDVGRAPLVAAIGSAYPELDFLRAAGEPDDRAAETQFRLSYDIHTRNLQQLVQAERAGQDSVVDLLAANDALTSSTLIKQAIAGLDRKLRQLSAFLVRVERRNGYIWAIAIPVLVVDIALLALCAGLLLAHQRRIERQAAENLHQARHDALTGVANRVLLLERARQALARTSPIGAFVGLLLLDLDRFKEVNDTLGHHAGDHLLREVSERLTELIRTGDTVARLGGDEFAVLLPTTAHENDSTDVARRILEALTRPVLLDGKSVAVAGSIGVAVAERGSCTVAELLQRADIAMYRAKRASLGLALFQPGDEEAVGLHLTQVDELRAGIRAGQLELHYQPKVSMDGRVHSVEALARWRHPERGLLGADAFVPLAESGGLIEELTDTVLAGALADQALWREGGVDVGIAVNLAATTLMSVGLPERIADLTRRFGTPHGRLGIEITESAVVADPQRAVRALESLRTLGVRIAIDDFGTGYASMAHLLTLPLDELKVDRTFVLALDQRSGLAIVRATIELAHAMDLVVVAEGVEDEATLEILRDLGCDCVQGYLYSRPLPSDELLAWFADRSVPGRTAQLT